MADRSVPDSEPSPLAPPPDAAAPQPEARQNAWRRTFAALRSPNYRLWFQGQLVSMVGTWMQITAQGFLVFELTHSSAYLGYVGFAGGVPSLLFMLVGGVVADRVPRRALLIITQSTMMLMALLLAGLSFAQVVQPWHIVVLALALGTANAFDAPAAQAFVLELVDRQDLPNAIALNASLFNLATVIGPTVAGLTYAAFGAAWCFTLNALSFVAVIVALFRMRLVARPIPPRTQSALAQLREGVRYTVTHPLLRTLIAIPAIAALCGMAYATLLPAWSVAVLGGDAATNGLLQSARGAGSLLGALMIATLSYTARRGRWLMLGTIGYPLALLGFAAMRTVPLSMLLLVAVGWSAMFLFNSANTLVQTHVSDALRGRVMSIYSLAFFGGMPLGALWAGALADIIGAPLTIVVGAIVILAFAGLLWIRVPQLRELA
jgi:predicted MFS family arabinose efflux permease